VVPVETGNICGCLFLATPSHRLPVVEVDLPRPPCDDLVMSDAPRRLAPPDIICEMLNRGTWVAWLVRMPRPVGCGKNAVEAVRRLLEAHNAGQGRYFLLCDADVHGGDRLRHEIIWGLGRGLSFPCLACDAREEYAGLLERDVCQKCGGRKFVPV
jgi:hypothetical protein